MKFKIQQYFNISIFKYFLIIGAIAVVSLGIFFWLRPTEMASAGWWNESWSYRKALTINSGQVVGSHTDFPVLVSLTDTSLGAHAQADGDDIIFIDTEGKKLSHEIESFATTTGALVAWVKFPTLSNVTDVQFWMYYGSASVASQEEVENVWSSGFSMVYHLGEAAGTTGSGSILDSTGNTAGTPSAGLVLEQTGVAGPAIDFASGTGIDCGIIGSPLLGEDATISFWIKSKSLVYPNRQNPFNQAYGGWGTFTLEPSGAMNYYMGSNGGDTNPYAGYSSSFTNSIDIWYYVTVVRSSNGDTYSYFRNGTAFNSSGYDATYPVVDTRTFTIGDGYVFPINGWMDEFRISSATRTSSWIQTEYNNQNNPTTFLVAQAEEVGPGPVGYWSFDEGYGATAHDSSSQNNDGTITGATWQDESMCVSGKCLLFDGDNDNVDGGAGTRPTTAMTISLWIKPTNIIDVDMIIQDFAWNSGNPYGYQLDCNSSLLALRAGNGSADDSAVVAIPWTQNSWQHIAVTWTSAGTAYFYRNGVYLGSGTTPASAMSYTGAGGMIMGTEIGNTNDFAGYLDEVKVYPYARSADQIRQDYAAGLAGMGTSQGASASFGSRSDKWMTDGLVGYWGMDEASWAAATSTLDSSGNGYNGNAHGSASTTAGKFGNGGVFDGNDDYVLTSDNIGISGNLSRSVTFWLKLNSNANQGMINWGFPAGGQLFQLLIHGTRYYFHVNSSDDWDTVVTPVLGSWQHHVVTYDGVNARWYINGNLIGTSPRMTLNTTDTAVMIGKRIDTTASIDGKLDEVRIYNRALSADEVRRLYEWAPGPVAHWTFDEKGGTTAYDSAASTTWSGGNHGTLGAGNAAPQWARGKNGSALRYDGNDDYVSIRPQNHSSVTVASWFYRDASDTVNADAVFGGWQWNADTQQRQGFDMRFYQGSPTNLNWIVETRSSTGTVSELGLAYDLGASQYGKWHFAAGTYDSETGTARLYVNGLLRDTIKVNSGNTIVPFAAYSDMRIGYSRVNNGFFNGLVDDVRIYNYARTQKQIIEDMLGDKSAIDAPVLNLKFDEGQGGTAHDSSIFKNDGTLVPGGSGSNTTASAMWDKNGKSDGAMEFDGTNDYVELGTPSALRIDKLNGQVTVSAWVKWGGQSGSLARIGGFSGYYGDYALWVRSDANILFEVDGQNGNAWYSNGKIATSTWTHVVGTFDQSAAKIYINGELDRSAVPSFYPPAAGSQNFRVGNVEDSYFNGLIDDFRVYNFALNADDVRALYNQGSTISLGGGRTESYGATTTSGNSSDYCVPGATDYCAPPVGEWKFDEKASSTAYDTSGNGNNGILGNWSVAAMPAWDRGKLGGALRYDGTDDYVQVPDSNSLDISSSGLTLDLWLKPDPIGSGTSETVLRKGVPFSGGNGGSYIVRFYINNMLYVYFEDGDASYSYILMSGMNYPRTDNKWHKVTITENEETGQTRINMYLDGVLSDSALKNDQVDYSNQTAELNFSGPSMSEDFTGLIDNVRVYNYARTPAQIAWEYNGGKPVAWWKFDECQGSTIHDEMNGNHGTLNLGASGVTATGTCASSSNSFWSNGRDGKRDAAGSFDGGSDYVGFSQFYNLTDFTIGLWVKSTTVGAGWYTLVSTESFRFSIPVDRSQVAMSWTNGASNNHVYSGSLMALDDWKYVTAVKSGTSINFYINGAPAGGGTVQYSRTISDIEFGRDTLSGIGSADYFSGFIDDVKIWSYALTAEQVKTEYAGGAVRFE